MQRIKYQIQEKVELCDGIISLTLKPKEAQIISFQSGQYAFFSFEQGANYSEEKPFAFSSSASEKSHIKIAFKVSSKFTMDLAQLKGGDTVLIKGPYGTVHFKEGLHKDCVFLAGGMGIAPFMSIIEFVAAGRRKNKITLFYSNRKRSQIAFYDRIKEIEKNNPHFKAVFNLSGEPSGSKEFLGGRINKEILCKNINGDLSAKTFFICGPESFSDTMSDILSSLGVKDSQIYQIY